MIHAAMLMFLAVPAEMPASTAVMPSKTASKSCREMLLSSSRLGMIKICKTRAEWRRWESCHGSVTRYCTPKKKEAALLSSWKSDRIVCKDIKETGSRLSVQRVCSSAREWRLAEEEAQKVLMDRQTRSMLTGGSEEVSLAPPR
ncbi:MAG TPA: hypothetical protein VFO42_00465 [Sphingomicrobium sp.]|nr:hypothetical protein [Sphingomicrobium sp.]